MYKTAKARIIRHKNKVTQWDNSQYFYINSLWVFPKRGKQKSYLQKKFLQIHKTNSNLCCLKSKKTSLKVLRN